MKAVAFFVFLLCAAPVFAQGPAAVPAPKSEVFYAMDATALGPGRVVNRATVRRMVDSLVCQLTGQRTAAGAWRTMVTPADRVGIKVAASGRAVSGTNPEVVLAVAEGLVEAGVPAKNIIVWDRNREDLLAAGYDPKSRFYTLESIDPRTGYDPKAQVSAPVVGKLIWGDSKFGEKKVSRFSDLLVNTEQLSSTSFYAKILSTGVTKVINIPSLTDSFMTGINGALANMTLTNLDNWRRFGKTAAEGDSYIAEIYADPIIRDKVVLTLLDGLVLQYAGGPFPDGNFAVDYFSLFASRDPVAIDATAVRLIEELRLAHKMPSIRTMSSYVEAAEMLGLGSFAEPRIQMIRVGVEGIR
jgi:uncharacterized protein (DUF362 family)